MQLRPQEIKNLTKAGIFIGILLFVSSVFVFFLGKESALFNRSLVLSTNVKNVDNLKVGAAVFLKGMKIGSIKDITFFGLESIKISYSVNANQVPWIRKNSEVYIRTQGMLGDKYLEIDGGSDDSPGVIEGDTLNHGGASGIGKFVDQGENIMLSTNQVLAQINQLLSDLNESGQIKATFSNLNNTAQTLNKVLSEIDAKKINDSIGNLNKMSKRLDDMSVRIVQGPGTAHSLIYDNSVYDDLRTLLGGAQRSQVLKYFIRELIKKGTKAE